MQEQDVLTELEKLHKEVEKNDVRRLDYHC